MSRGVICVLTALVCIGMVTGCATKSDLKAVDARVTTAQNGIRGLEAKLNQFAEVQKSMQARILTFEAGLQANAGRIGGMSTEFTKVKIDVATLQTGFDKTAKALIKSQEILVANLENARDIYKRQYLALEQILEQMKPAPAEAPK